MAGLRKVLYALRLESLHTLNLLSLDGFVLICPSYLNFSTTWWIVIKSTYNLKFEFRMLMPTVYALYSEDHFIELCVTVSVLLFCILMELIKLLAETYLYNICHVLFQTLHIINLAFMSILDFNLLRDCYFFIY